MSRKIRVPKAQIDVLPSPAWTYFLLVGEPAADRIRGWVSQGQAGLYGEPTAGEVWTQHQDALIAEARAHGFDPFWATKHRPRDDGFEQWQRQFLQPHRY